VKLSSSVEDALASALGDFTPSQHSLTRLALHWECLVAWQSRLNLTSIHDISDAIWHHYRDSAEVTRLISTGSVLDVGSGGGFPGVPMAILCPDLEVTALECRRKRVSFLRTLRVRLKLDNFHVIHGRSTDTPSGSFDAVVTRATFSDRQGLASCLPWLREGGRLFAMRSGQRLDMASDLITYSLADQARNIEIWTKVSDP
jgi:16S rRNA (guanine527-N7)-methyltransferase